MELVWKPSEQLMATLNAFVSLYGYEQVSGAIFKMKQHHLLVYSLNQKQKKKNRLGICIKNVCVELVRVYQNKTDCSVTWMDQ